MTGRTLMRQVTGDEMETNTQERRLTQDEVIAHVKTLTYKPGWTVAVRKCGANDVDVDLRGTTIDTSRWGAERSEKPRSVGRYLHIDGGVTQYELELQLARSLVELEVHETLEFVRFVGYAPFHPHHYGSDVAAHLADVTADLRVR